MKIVIFSDNHGDLFSVEKVLNYNQDADKFFHLGDSEVSYEIFKKHNVIAIQGNHPFDPKEYPSEKLVEYYGKKMLLVHGHLNYVKFGLTKLSYKAEEENADIVFYGHTHIPKVSIIEDVYYINPGSTFLPKGGYPATYAILYLDNQQFHVEFRKIEDNQLIEL